MKYSGKKLRYIETIVNEDGSIDDKIVLYKPMKGGHTHNHLRNALERKLNKSKASRNRCHNYLNNNLLTR